MYISLLYKYLLNKHCKGLYPTHFCFFSGYLIKYHKDNNDMCCH